MKLATKKVFLLKVVLGIIFATHTGNVIAQITAHPYYEMGVWGSFMPEFIYTFFPLACVVIMQWLLLSDFLPKWWVTLGFVGSLIAAIAIGIIFRIITFEIHHSYQLQIDFLNAAISGFLLALPQWIILKAKKGYLWILANSVGLVFYSVGWDMIVKVPMLNEFYFSLARVSLISVIPFGLMIGFYLYFNFYKANYSLSIEDRN